VAKVIARAREGDRQLGIHGDASVVIGIVKSSPGV